MNQSQQDDLIAAVRDYETARAHAAVRANELAYKRREETFSAVINMVIAIGQKAQTRRREYEKAQAQNRAEWNAEAVEAQHRFRVDDARADYIADNYSPEDYR